jgi:hypothetical protein
LTLACEWRRDFVYFINKDAILPKEIVGTENYKNTLSFINEYQEGKIPSC